MSRKKGEVNNAKYLGTTAWGKALCLMELRCAIQDSTSLSRILKAWLGQMVIRSEMVHLGVIWLDVEALINYHNG